MANFIVDVQAIRTRAQHELSKGAVTPGYGCDLQTVLKLLNDSLATEMICALRYRQHYYTASGLSAEIAAGEFLEHSGQELDHAHRLASRVAQLGGKPALNP